MFAFLFLLLGFFTVFGLGVTAAITGKMKLCTAFVIAAALLVVGIVVLFFMGAYNF